MQESKLFWLRILIHLAALLPLAILAWDFAHGGLTADPIRELQLRTGKYTLILLVSTLAYTPISKLLRFNPRLRLRRMLGLYAFFYASLHLLNFIGLDYRFDFGLIFNDVLDKRYVIIGLAAFLMLIPLAVTSTKGWMKRLGKNWERLHWLVYLSALLAVIHYVWLVRGGVLEPVLYGITVTLLLITRIPLIDNFLSRFHS